MGGGTCYLEQVKKFYWKGWLNHCLRILWVCYFSLSLCEYLERLMMIFGGGNGSSDNKSLCWMSWRIICILKLKGGLNLKKLHEFKLPIPFKQGWKILTSPQSFVACLYKTRYFHLSTLLDVNLDSNLSYIWRSILAEKDLCTWLRRRIGSAASCPIWGYLGLPDKNNPFLESDVILSISQHNTNECWR